MPSLQACASVGQCVLSAAYDEEFRAVGLLTSLVLLTRGDTARRTSYLHARDALTRLVDLGVVPIVNENDTTAVDEIKFGDNDTLAALVSCLVSADLCVTLSDIDGLYTANPSLDPTAKFIPRVDKIDAAIIGSAGDSTTTVGTGGMITKIRSCRILMTAGIESVICSGAEERPLVRLAAGEQVGTRFRPPAARLEIAPRKLWIALGDSAHGFVTVDAGARARWSSAAARCCRWALRASRGISPQAMYSTYEMQMGSLSLAASPRRVTMSWNLPPAATRRTSRATICSRRSPTSPLSTATTSSCSPSARCATGARALFTRGSVRTYVRRLP